MNARFMAIGVVVGLVLAVAVLSPPTAAQVDGDKGLFSDLKVGQMVEMRNDPRVGMIITYYDDPTPADNIKMTSKIADIGRDFIALEYQDAASGVNLEMRYPINAIAGVCHMKKKMAAKPGPKKKPAAD
jgi:hypothetical protein